MPQLDKVSFLSQFFWLCVFFFGFYIFQLKFFLPEMSRILKFRKKRLSESLAVLLQQENTKVRNSADTVLENLFKNSKNIFKDSFSRNDSWFLNQTKFFQKKFKKGNQNYLQSIAKKNLSNNFAIGAVGLHVLGGTKADNNSVLSNKTFWSLIAQRISYQGSVLKKNYTTTSPSGVSRSLSQTSEGKTKNSSSAFSIKEKLKGNTGGEKRSIGTKSSDSSSVPFSDDFALSLKAKKNVNKKDQSSKSNEVTAEKKQKKKQKK